MKDIQVQLIRPPVLVRRGSGRRVSVRSAQNWALTCAFHVFSNRLLLCQVNRPAENCHYFSTQVLWRPPLKLSARFLLHGIGMINGLVACQVATTETQSLQHQLELDNFEPICF